MQMDDVDTGGMFDARSFLMQKRAKTSNSNFVGTFLLKIPLSATARRDPVALKRLGRESTTSAGLMKNFKVVAGGSAKNEGAEALLKELRVVKQLHANSIGAPAKVHSSHLSSYWHSSYLQRTVAATSTSTVTKMAPTSIIRRAVRTVQNTKADAPAAQPVLTSTAAPAKKATVCNLMRVH